MGKFIGFIKLSITSYDERSTKLTFDTLDEVDEYRYIMKKINSYEIESLYEFNEFVNNYEFKHLKLTENYITDLVYNWSLTSLTNDDDDENIMSVDSQDWFEEINSNIYKKIY